MEDSVTITLPFQDSESLCLNTFGHSVTAPGHRYGPSVRSYYLIHFILKGKGTFCVNGITYNLSAGQGFFIAPDYQTVYTADEQDPWVYIWVAFSGKEAKHMLETSGLSIAGIAYSCGYQNPESFMKIFKRTFHMTPSAYRKQQAEKKNV